MTGTLTIVIYISLAIHVSMMGIVLWRIVRGENQVDRLMGVDLIGMLSLAVLILIGLIYRAELYFDIAMGLAALGFVSTIALARAITTDQMF